LSHPSSMVMTRIGGREYPMRSVPNCKTCQSPHRLHVENLLLTAGRTFAAISRELPEDAGLSPENLADHYNRGHMPLQLETRIRIRERRAEEIGKQLDDGATLLVDQVVAADTILQIGYERLLAGEITPDVSDMLVAAKFRQQVEREMGEAIDTEMWVSSINELLSEAEAVMPPEMWANYGQRLLKNPVLNALRQKQKEESAAQAIEA
jgi:hypothetical protein